MGDQVARLFPGCAAEKLRDDIAHFRLFSNDYFPQNKSAPWLVADEAGARPWRDYFHSRIFQERRRQPVLPHFRNE
jgi:hypothetical protein